MPYIYVQDDKISICFFHTKSTCNPEESFNCVQRIHLLINIGNQVGNGNLYTQVASAAAGGDSDSKSESGASAASSNPTPPVSASPSRRGSKVATAEELVKQFGGRRTINKILIANNGIAGRFSIYVVTSLYEQ